MPRVGGIVSVKSSTVINARRHYVEYVFFSDDGPTGTADTEVEAPTVVEPQEVKSCLTGSIVFDGETVTRNETLQDCPLGQVTLFIY